MWDMSDLQKVLALPLSMHKLQKVKEISIKREIQMQGRKKGRIAWFAVPTEVARGIIWMKGRLFGASGSIFFWDSHSKPVTNSELEDICDRIDCLILAKDAKTAKAASLALIGETPAEDIQWAEADNATTNSVMINKDPSPERVLPVGVSQGQLGVLGPVADVSGQTSCPPTG